MPRHKYRRHRRAPARPAPDARVAVVDSDDDSVTSSIADDYIANLLEQEPPGTPVTPFRARRSSSSSASSSPRSSSSSSSSGSPAPSPHTSPPRSRPPARQLVLDDAMLAFDKFSQRQASQSNHACAASADARHRLALHRAAELLGATSASSGARKQRRVVFFWPPGKRVPITVAGYQRGVTRILDELIPERRSTPPAAMGGRARQREFAKRVRLATIFPDEHTLVGDTCLGDTRVGDTRGKRGTKDRRSSRPREADKVGRGNVGFNMLEKMGWSEGTGLGAERDGRVDPILSERRSNRAGIGS